MLSVYGARAVPNLVGEEGSSPSSLWRCSLACAASQAIAELPQAVPQQESKRCCASTISARLRGAGTSSFEFLSLEGEPSVRSFLLLSYSFGEPSDDEERRGDAFWWAL